MRRPCCPLPRGGARRGGAVRCRTSAESSRGSRPRGRRGRWPQGSRPVAGPELCRAGQGRKGRRFRDASDKRSKPAVLAIDAAHGFAYPALDLAVAGLPASARARASPRRVRRSHHCGAAGHPVERLAEEGIVAILFANTPAAIAPWGGSVGVFGTNPIAFACPLPGRAPDRGRSVPFEGRARQHPRGQAAGRAIPEGWALDAAGATDDRSRRCAQRHHAAPRRCQGYGSGADGRAPGGRPHRRKLRRGPVLSRRGGAPPGTGQLILVLDPVALGGEETLSHCGRLAAAIEDQPGARLPGRAAPLREVGAATSGLTISDKMMQDLRALAWRIEIRKARRPQGAALVVVLRRALPWTLRGGATESCPPARRGATRRPPGRARRFLGAAGRPAGRAAATPLLARFAAPRGLGRLAAFPRRSVPGAAPPSEGTGGRRRLCSSAAPPLDVPVVSASAGRRCCARPVGAGLTGPSRRRRRPASWEPTPDQGFEPGCAPRRSPSGRPVVGCPRSEGSARDSCRWSPCRPADAAGRAGSAACRDQATRLDSS